ncbi:MAG: BrnT family toxin [Thermodesulfobacteriota bacterium]|nr:BrnT family toxin [Thermodesulfobacteriota bacterium]
MKIQDIIWLDVFVEKIWRKHQVLTVEVEEALYSSPEIRFIEKGDVKGENVYAAMGKSRAGKYIITFFIKKAGDIALVISARNMTKRERKLYGRKKEKLNP